MSAIYDRDYFIAKFEAIPDEQWTTHYCVSPDGGHCALGHCGAKGLNDDQLTPEAFALMALLDANRGKPWSDGKEVWGAVNVNDNHDDRYQQETPKARVLAALRALPEATA